MRRAIRVLHHRLDRQMERFSAFAVGLTRTRRPLEDLVGIGVDLDLHELTDGELLGEAFRHVAAELEPVVVDQLEQRRARSNIFAAPTPVV